MIQTKEELFLAELGINTKEEIEADYGSRIKITDLLKKYRAEQLTIPVVVGRSEQLAEHECKFYVNAEWTALSCECGKRMKPKG